MTIKYLYATNKKQVLARNKKEALYLFSLDKGKVIRWSKVRRIGYATREYRNCMCKLDYGDLYSNKPISYDEGAKMRYLLLRV